MRSLGELLVNRSGRGKSEDADEVFQELKESAESYSHSINVHLSARDINRWKLAHRYIQTYIRTFELSGWEGNLTYRLSNLLIQRYKDWPDVKDILLEIDIATGFSLAAFIYGGLHALAWSAPFHSSTEQLLWRISACIVMGSLPATYAVVAFLRKEDRRRGPSEHRSYDHLIGNIIRALIVLIILIILIYVLARLYLVVECFINLSHLPAGVYYLPNWSAYFPHIS